MCDSKLIESEHLAYSEWVEWLDRKLSSEGFRAWNDPDPLVWIAESTALRDRIYPEDPDLGWDYRYAWTSTIQRRISQAGVRTAAYLNALFSRDTGGSDPGGS